MITQPIEIGKFGRTHALNGHIRVFSYTDPQENIFTYQPCYIQQDDTFTLISVKLIRATKQGFIASIKDIDTPEKAQKYVDKIIYIEKSMLPVLKQGYYWHDLVNKDVYNLSNKNLGIVTALHDNGAHDLLLIKKGNGKLLYIPFIDQYIIKVENNIITVDWEYED
ncbi:MAG: ribosome maturation factor RimM [Gammaproteobacteria bacterium]|nr:ribosome maturation factor RimM [Gammaproteobacteria bacterium]